MSHAPTVLQPAPKKMSAPPQPIQARPQAAPVLHVTRASAQLSFQFHRLP
ncbi:MAG: hypothetical protein HS128_18930 [Ideonella sp.]|nr:hypothetical protein [Ideonella sp.]MCC7457561.1 hypothetical protein [Nitrospira sp.]